MLRRMQYVMFGTVGWILIGGCRTATHVQQVPRVDLGLRSGGNRGYLVGSPPSVPELKTTRQIIRTDIEIPSFYKSDASKASSFHLHSESPSFSEPAMADGAQPVGAYDTYVVQKGDSLWSIASKPQIYGRVGQWRRIFDANRDLLKEPGKLRAGMTLKIPRDQQQSEDTFHDSHAGFKK